MAKKRTDIPSDIAARVLFVHDRTCCVCRKAGKPVQLHHLDENPSHHDPSNLAVLCFDCHRDTQIRGGFDRKLDREQIVLYRDDWIRLVAHQRVVQEARREHEQHAGPNVVEIATSIAEIYRERHEYQLLALHYDTLGNTELRDKYIELALRESPDDEDIAFLRSIQGREDLIPPDVIERKLKSHDAEGDLEQKARFLCSIGRPREATIAYLQGILESLNDGNDFSAAFYLKEVASAALHESLFELALRQAAETGDLWWQVRALQELGWETELKDLLLRNADAITKSDNLDLQLQLARIRGYEKEIVRLEKEIARTETWSWTDEAEAE